MLVLLLVASMAYNTGEFCVNRGAFALSLLVQYAATGLSPPDEE